MNGRRGPCSRTLSLRTSSYGGGSSSSYRCSKLAVDDSAGLGGCGGDFGLFGSGGGGI